MTRLAYLAGAATVAAGIAWGVWWWLAADLRDVRHWLDDFDRVTL